MFLGINQSDWLLIGQTVCLIITVILILLQQRGASLGTTFGSAGEVYLTRRGIEKWVVNLTVVFIAIFAVLRFISFFMY
jgi:protein translocase SecG subunit